MRYYIDGYNVTKRDPSTRNLSIEEQRDALERRLRIDAGRALGRASYTIVWDGAGGEGVVREPDPHVAFTRKPTADDAIVERVRGAKERVGVVTSDRGLAARPPFTEWTCCPRSGCSRRLTARPRNAKALPFPATSAFPRTRTRSTAN